jgi:hypothetical protein
MAGRQWGVALHVPTGESLHIGETVPRHADLAC